MSKERARRRAAREQDAAVRRARAQRRRTRTDRRRAAVASLTRRWSRLWGRARWGRQQGLLARRRRLQNGVILCLVLASQLVVWLLTPDLWVRGGSALLAVVATPVVVTLVLDRRS